MRSLLSIASSLLYIPIASKTRKRKHHKMSEASRTFLRPMLGFFKEMTLKTPATKRNLSWQDLEHCKGPKGDKACVSVEQWDCSCT